MHSHGGRCHADIATSNVVIDRSDIEQHLDARPGEYVRITVSDNGSGIDDEQMDQIFDPFFTTKGFGVNTGLGPATVMGAVRQNDGFVTVLAVLVEALSRTGYTVIKATNPSAAIQLAESPPGHIDLMITDISMPGMNGFDLAIEVEKRNPAIRRMFISGYHDDLTQRLDTFDDYHYLHKPFTLDDLLTAVRAALTDADSGPL